MFNGINDETAQPKSMAPPVEQDATSPPRIVVAEDDEEMARLLVRALERAGYEVTACENGWQLLELLGVFPQKERLQKVALVVSDIRLPGITGLDALKAGGYIGNFPPVILITAFGDSWTHTEARRLGAITVLDKPFEIDELVTKVRTLVPPVS
jgi:DNA-binding response OmpR family regulator